MYDDVRFPFSELTVVSFSSSLSNLMKSVTSCDDLTNHNVSHDGGKNDLSCEAP